MLLLGAFPRLNSQLHLPLLTPAAPKLVTELAALHGLSRMHLLPWRLNQKMRQMPQLAEKPRVNQTKDIYVLLHH
jgi:hypothetical protein